MTTTINIYRDDVWAGTGTIDDDGWIECEAVLGPDQDASDECYEEIADAIECDHGSIERPDGVYSWTIASYELVD